MDWIALAGLIITVLLIFAAIIGSYATLRHKQDATDENVKQLAERKRSEIERLERRHSEDIKRLEDADKRLAEADKEIIILMNSRFDSLQSGMYALVSSIGELRGELRVKRD